MKKITSFFAAILLIMSVSATVTVETNWQLSAATTPSTLPTWVGTGNYCRGLAYGKMGGNDRVFAISRQDGNLVHILNAATGEKTGTMNMGTAVISGGTFVINDGGVTEDGKLIVCNMVMPGDFKAYLWIDETSAPIVALTSTIAAGRYGDKVTIVGNYTTGTAKIYAANATLVSGLSKVLCWSMIPDTNNAGKFIFNSTPTEIGNFAAAASNPGVGLRPDGSFFFKYGGGQITQFTAAGVAVGAASNPSVVASGGNTVRYIGKNTANDEFICYFRNGSGKEKINILKLPQGDLSTATVVDSTASLGANGNTNATSGLIVNVLANNDVEFFVLSTNNGIGKYTVKGLFAISSGIDDNTSENIRVISKENTIAVEGVEASAIELFNSTGQKAGSSSTNSISTSGLHGLYIVRVKEAGKIVKTTKVLIK